jgi:hypothetical protein
MGPAALLQHNKQNEFFAAVDILPDQFKQQIANGICPCGIPWTVGLHTPAPPGAGKRGPVAIVVVADRCGSDHQLQDME